MKKSFFMCFFLWCMMAMYCQSQSTEPLTGPTNSEEYNYCTTGYKLQLQMELPMKKGYELVDVTTVEQGERKVQFKSLIRKDSKKACALMMIYSKPRMAPQYFCIPTSDAGGDIWQQFYASLNSDTENERDVFRMLTYAMAKAAAVLSE